MSDGIVEKSKQALSWMGPGWVMWLLVVLFMVAATLASRKAWELMASRPDLETLRNLLGQFDKLNTITQAQADEFKGKFPRKTTEESVLRVALEHVINGEAATEEHTAVELAFQRRALESRLTILSAVGSNAAFLGLLGTVIGILRAFDNDQAVSIEFLKPKIAEALVSTALGLFVAILAVVSVTLLQRAVEARLADAYALSRLVVAFANRVEKAKGSTT